jgi:hypothetical protein
MLNKHSGFDSLTGKLIRISRNFNTASGLVSCTTTTADAGDAETARFSGMAVALSFNVRFLKSEPISLGFQYNKSPLSQKNIYDFTHHLY